jgi:spoIIIJ-associated protein
MLKMTGIEVAVTAENSEDGRAILAVNSDDSALLIGRKARNLEALQYLINRMVKVDEATAGVERFIVDVENYLERRKEAIAEMALAMAHKAKESRREVRLKPMPARERRIVHVTLQDDPDLKTFSQGSGMSKVVVIQPKNALPNNRRNRGGHGPKAEAGGAEPRPGNRGNHPQGRRQTQHPAQGQRTRREGRGRGHAGGDRQGGAPNPGALD